MTSNAALAELIAGFLTGTPGSVPEVETAVDPVVDSTGAPDISAEPAPNVHWKHYLILLYLEVRALREHLGAPAPLAIPPPAAGTGEAS